MRTITSLRAVAALVLVAGVATVSLATAAPPASALICGCGGNGGSGGPPTVYQPTLSLGVSPSTGTAGVAIEGSTITATLANGDDPTGTITFYESGPSPTAPSPCVVGAMNEIGTAAVTDGDAAYTSTGSFSPASAGDYWLYATYGGDDTDSLAYSACAPTSSQEITVYANATTPTISTTVQDVTDDGLLDTPSTGTEVTGVNVSDIAVVSGAGAAPTGSVAFTLYSDSTCGTVLGGSYTASLDGTGTSGDWGFVDTLSAGSYSFGAVYSGDSTYSSVSDCEAFTVAQATPSLTTTVGDVTTGSPWGNTEPIGDEAQDTAVLSNYAISGSNLPTGSVTYTLYGASGCSGTVISTQPVSLGRALNEEESGYTATIPASSGATSLAEGSYSYEASYSGDPNYNTVSATCENFSVGPATPGFSTTVLDASTGDPWSGSEVTGAVPSDSASVTGVVGDAAPTGTVTFTLFIEASCEGNSYGLGTYPLDEVAPGDDAATVADLAAGSYSYKAVYSGDSTYASVSECETFSVDRAPLTITTKVFDGTAQTTWTGDEVTGASAYDTATITGAAGGYGPLDQVTYTLYDNASCQSPSTSQQEVTPGGNWSVPNSSTTSSLGAGSYSFQASYGGGDPNYLPVTGSCESFIVNKATPSLATNVDDAASGTKWSGTEVAGASAYDTASLTGLVAGFTPSGSIVYTFFDNGSCSPSGGTLQPTLGLNANGTVPNSLTESNLAAGNYSFQAVYSSGNPNYNGVTSSCETFSVAQATPTITTTPSATSVAMGKTPPTLKDTATLGGGDTPTGTITFTLYYDGGTSPVDTETVNVSGNGTYTTPTGYTPPNTSVAFAGFYQWDASYSGDNNNVTVSDVNDPLEVVTVTAAGQVAFGDGWYSVAGATTNFGFTVYQLPRSSIYLGQLNVVTPGKWWFQANVTSLGLTSTTQALIGGTGTLYSWSASLNRGHGGWQFVKSGVTYKATADATNRSAKGSFGITINYSPSTGLPNSSPTTLTHGSIFIF
jgi:hypothetical protein